MGGTSSVGNSYGLFMLITVIYIILDYTTMSKRTEDPKSKMKQGLTYALIYCSALIVIELFVNLSLTSEVCGSAQWGSAVFATIFPWGLIFGSVMLLLNMFPGWLVPFSNTFGYLIAVLGGVNGVVSEILLPRPHDSSKGANSATQAALAHIYGNKSLMVNEITSSSFNSFWIGMKSLMKQNAFESVRLKDELYKLVVMKESAAKFLWYVLAGGLVTSVSFNYIVNSACSMSIDEMEERHKEYEETIAKQHSNEKDEKPRVYSTTE